MSKARVCIVMQWHPAHHVGGAEVQAELLGTGLLQRGWDVHYVAEFPAGSTLPAQGTGGLAVHPLVQRAHDLSILNYPQLARLCDALRPALYYQRVGNPYTAMVARIAERQGRPFVWAASSTADCAPRKFGLPLHAPGFSPKALIKGSGRYALRRVDDLAYSYGIDHAAAAVCQTLEQAELLKDWKGIDGAVIGNGHPVPSPTLGRSPQPLVLWIANLKTIKRPLLFLDLARALAHLDARFVMIGYAQDQELGREVQRQGAALANFHYTGGLPLERVNAWCEQAHVLVCTSLYEGFPNTFLQGWLRGVPTVSLGIDPDGVLERARIGRCVPTFADLVATTRALLADGHAWQEMSQRARQYALDHHSLTRMLDRYEQLFETVLRHPGTAVA